MADTLTIRTAVPDDAAAVEALLRRSYPRLLKADYPPSIMVTAVPILTRAQPRLLSSGTYYVAVGLDGAILGAGGWTARRRPGTASMRHVAVDPDATRRGIGRTLYSHILRKAQTARIREMECLATRTAVPFYRAMGFATLGPVDIPLARGIVFPAIQMYSRL